jgi:hypothetical protein
MKLRKHLYTLGIAFMILSITDSCEQSAKEIETASLTSNIMKLNLSDTIKWIVILPGLGCHGCIQEAEVFMKDYINNKEILFVLTKISSLKILQQKINIEIKNHPNIHIDTDNKFSITTDNNIYPCILQIENGEFVTYEFQSPQNVLAFSNLKKLIKNSN